MDKWALDKQLSKSLWQTLRDLANNDFAARTGMTGAKLQLSTAGLQADMSRHSISTEALTALTRLAQCMHLGEWIQRLFSGQAINHTESRPALHMALRGSAGDREQQQAIQQCLQQMHRCTEALTSGSWLGYSGKTIRDIVNIGIGGSDLGPRMVCEALRPYHNARLKVHFCANIDPADLQQTLCGLNPETTLFIVASKSWSTLETLTNALNARAWLLDAADGANEAIARHFIAISARTDRCAEFGIRADNVLPMWDWVGGRFSLWSAIGLPIALATSFAHFEQLLAGARIMDLHFRDTAFSDNMPVMMALLECWHINVHGARSVAVLPYDHSLRLLPDHLQQLVMESNGKSVNRGGEPLDYATSPVIWGAAGTIGQHSFHQLLHQGTEMIPVEFILPLSSHHPNQHQHAQLVANCLAQSQLLSEGLSRDQAIAELRASGLSAADACELAAHKSMPGGRPSTLLTMDKLTPEALGSLIALYEHKVFVQSVIWDINPFDQWGVERGKRMSDTIYQLLTNKADGAELNDSSLDSASQRIVQRYQKLHSGAKQP